MPSSFFVMLSLAFVGWSKDPTLFPKCASGPSLSLKSAFDRCAKPATKAKKAMIVDADSKCAWILSPSPGRQVIATYPVTVGAASQGNPANLGTGNNQTQPGYFETAVHNGEKYQTNAASLKSRGLGIRPATGGRIIHDSHGNRTTAGCIGIKNRKYDEVAQHLGTNGAPVYIGGKNYLDCGREGRGGGSSRSGVGRSKNNYDGNR